METVKEVEAMQFEEFLNKVTVGLRLRQEFRIWENGQLLRSMGGRIPICRNRKTAEIIAEAFGLDPRSSVTEAPAYVPESRGRRPKPTSDFTIDANSDEALLKRALLEYALMSPQNRPRDFKSQRCIVERFFGPLKGNILNVKARVREIMKEIQRRHREIETTSKWTK